MIGLHYYDVRAIGPYPPQALPHPVRTCRNLEFIVYHDQNSCGHYSALHNDSGTSGYSGTNIVDGLACEAGSIAERHPYLGSVFSDWIYQ